MATCKFCDRHTRKVPDTVTDWMCDKCYNEYYSENYGSFNKSERQILTKHMPADDIDVLVWKRGGLLGGGDV